MAHYQVRKIVVAIVGAKSCGKTSLSLAFSLGSFHQNTKSLGVASLEKTCKWRGENVVVHIRDTAGEEKFESVPPIHYRNADAVIVCYDVTDTESFDRVQYWSDQAAGVVSEQSFFFLAGCKSDLMDMTTVTTAVGREAANTFFNNKAEVKFFETSAKTHMNIEELFKEVISSVMSEGVLTSHESGHQGILPIYSGRRLFPRRPSRRNERHRRNCSKC